MRRTAVTRAFGAVAVAAGTIAALGVPAAAAEPAAPAEPVAPQILHAMQRDLGVTADQAKHLLGAQQNATQLEDTLRGTLKQAFGGAHFDVQQGKLIVGVTEASKLDDVRATGAQARLVQHSVGQLNSVANGLNESQPQASSAISGWYVDSSSNSVVVTVANGAAQQAKSFVESAGVNADAVRVVESAETPRTYADIIGGNAYQINNSSRCSVGFPVQGGFVTAGHCGSAGDTTSQPSGTVEASSFPNNDYAWVSAGSATPRPLVNKYDGTNVTVAGSTEAAEGAAICRSGSTTGWHCGTVEAKNQTVRYPQGTVNGLTRTNVCAEPGDSGGSWLAGNQAQGVTSGGSGDCTSGGTTYFQPVNEILDTYGLTLTTG